MKTKNLNTAIRELRKFFKSELWTSACLDDQPTISEGGFVGEGPVQVNTKINLALDFEGKFNDMAHKYMKWRKNNNLSEEIQDENRE